MEAIMQPAQRDHAGDRRLRFVFDDSVMSFSLATDATFEDVARKWGLVARRHAGTPLAIDVTLPVPSPSSGGGFARTKEGNDTQNSWPRPGDIAEYIPKLISAPVAGIY